MARTLRLSPAAEADFDDIWVYTSQHWSRKQANTYYDKLFDACEDLASGKKQGRPSGILPDCKKYSCGSHVIYYTESAQHCNIVRILHQRQDAVRHLH